jgi:hypothetical protein
MRLDLTKLFPFRRLPGLVAVGVAGCCVFLAGCQQQEAIETYSVPKQHVVDRLNHVDGAADRLVQATAGPERTMAAIVLRDAQGWFFKLAGPPDEVGKQQDAFQSFVKSIKFAGPQSNPTWTLPKGWEEQPGTGMRYVTIEIETAGKPLELSVMSLPRGDTSESEYLLANINRWRGQVSLPPIQSSQLSDESQEIELADGKATIIDVKGTASGGGMGRPPFAGGGPMSAVGSDARTEAAPAAMIEYTAPEGWKALPLPPDSMRKAAFEVAQDGQRLEITAIDLDPAAGELLPNVNRWRGQVKLPEIDEAQLKKDLQPIEVDGHKGYFVELNGPGEGEASQSLLGAIVITPEKAWFFKLMGPTPLAEQEKARFEAFTKSVKFK